MWEWDSCSIIISLLLFFNKKTTYIPYIRTSWSIPIPKIIIAISWIWNWFTEVLKGSMHSQKMVLGLKTFNCFPHESYLSILFYCPVLYFRIYIELRPYLLLACSSANTHYRSQNLEFFKREMGSADDQFLYICTNA